ncbi:MAG: hypothetical protein Q7K54_03260, partial [Candidatus Parcubacteria bacterium]|nr:hypothetical protein [Candidatus Parcubacteria bacterium]
DHLITILFFFSIICSIFFGIKSLRKIPTIEGKRKIFDVIPQSVPGWLAFISVFISTLLFTMMTIGLFISPI